MSAAPMDLVLLGVSLTSEAVACTEFGAEAWHLPYVNGAAELWQAHKGRLAPGSGVCSTVSTRPHLQKNKFKEKIIKNFKMWPARHSAMHRAPLSFGP